MTSAHGVGWLQANTSITFGDNQDSNAGTTAVAFVPIVSSYVGKLAWFRSHTGSAGAITRLQLWDTVTQTAVIDLTSFTDDGSVGWQETDVSSLSVAVYAGREYRLAWQYPANTYTAGGYVTSYDPGGGSCNYAAVPNVYRYPPGYGYPNNPDATKYLRGIDIQLNTGGGTPPAGGGDADLARWLRDDSDNSHKDTSTIPGLPWTTKQAVDAAAVVTDAIKTVVDNIPQATDAPWVDALKLWKIAGALTDLEIAAWNTFAQRAPSQLTGGSGGGGSAFFASGGRQVAQAASDALDVASLLLALRRNALVDFPGTPWVMADETTFDTDIAYAQEADLYVVTFTSLGSNIVNTVAAGVDVSYRLAWWTPLIGAFGQQRRFIDTPSTHLWLDGTRLPGVLLHSPAGAAGTIQAWLYA